MTASPSKTPAIKLRRRSTLKDLVSTKNRQGLRCLPTHPYAGTWCDHDVGPTKNCGIVLEDNARANQARFNIFDF
jgi:hypothetical protein